MKKSLQNNKEYYIFMDRDIETKEGFMRLGVVVMLVFALMVIGCTTRYTFTPEDKLLLENALNQAKESKALSESAISSANKASMEADRAEKAADRAEGAADRAEKAADRAETAADTAERAAEKAVKAFEIKQRK